MASLLAPSSAAAAGESTYWGAYLANAPADTTQIDAFESHAGKKMSIEMFGQPWETGGSFRTFPTAYMTTIRNRGTLPLLDWGSWDYCCGATQPSFTLASIYTGKYDAYLTSWAQGAKAWGHPFFLRFDHEMNGWWYPWNEQANGNAAGDFVKAWRHVHDIFTAQGATNVTWVWCPNIVGSRSTPMTELYPGDTYVDWTCMDGYNWGTDHGNLWQTFSQVFAGSSYNANHNTYNELLTVAPSKPIMIGETASSENGGSKSGWITDMFSKLPTAFPKIKAILWFNWNANDPTLFWPIETSASAQSAFAAGVANPAYAANLYANQTTSPIPALGAAPAPAPAPAPATAPAPAPTTTSAPAPAPTTPVVGTTGTVTLTPVADTFTTKSAPTSTAGGTATTLSADFQGTDTTFLRFDMTPLAGKTITAANLRIETSGEAWAGSAIAHRISYVSDIQWKEQYMSFNNTVPLTSVVLGSLSGTTTPSTWYEAPLALSTVQARTGTQISMAIDIAPGSPADVLMMLSRESGAGAPQLVLTYK